MLISEYNTPYQLTKQINSIPLKEINIMPKQSIPSVYANYFNSLNNVFVVAYLNETPKRVQTITHLTVDQIKSLDHVVLEGDDTTYASKVTIITNEDETFVLNMLIKNDEVLSAVLSWTPETE
jgi:hypothetical protein